MLCRIYLRASAQDQDAGRARADLLAFAADQKLIVAKIYQEQESGAKLDRPKLRELLDDCQPGDMILLEAIDRLTRLVEADWVRLRAEIKAKQVRVVSLDLPTSYMFASVPDEFTARLFAAMNDMLMDTLAAVARKDYQDRRRRQKQGIEKCRLEAGYKGRREDQKRNNGIALLLSKGLSWSQVMTNVKCSRATVAKVAARLRVGEA
jgi:DNA invertase Pin-like site-specific DNA recombinase